MDQSGRRKVIKNDEFAYNIRKVLSKGLPRSLEEIESFMKK